MCHLGPGDDQGQDCKELCSCSDDDEGRHTGDGSDLRADPSLAGFDHCNILCVSLKTA